MNRRSLLSLILGAPVAASVPEVKAATALSTGPRYVLGQILDTVEVGPDPRYTTCNAPCIGILRRKIYDGYQFVDMDSIAGGQVLTKVLTGTGSTGLSMKPEC